MLVQCFIRCRRLKPHLVETEYVADQQVARMYPNTLWLSIVSIRKRTIIIGAHKTNTTGAGWGAYTLLGRGAQVFFHYESGMYGGSIVTAAAPSAAGLGQRLE